MSSKSKRETSGGFYIETTGRIITAADLPNLTPSEIDELRESPLSKFDALFIHQSNHRLSSSLQSFMMNESLKEDNIKEMIERLDGNVNSKFNDLKNQFFVSVNGNGEKKHISELIIKHHKDMSGLRWRSNFKDLIKKNKTIVWVLTIATSIFVLISKDFFVKIFDNIF